MKIGLCMSVIGGGGGNDMIFKSLREYLINKNHNVTVFNNTNTRKNRLPVFGLFRQLQTIDDKYMHEQDLLIFLTGNPPKTKVPIIYYHQQIPASIFTKNGKPEKYKKGLWSIYYNIFAFVAGLKRDNILFNDNIHHYSISLYLQEQLSYLEIDADLCRPAIDNSIINNRQKQNKVITVCRISPEKNLAFNMQASSGYNYTICGSTDKYTSYYCNELKKRLEPRHRILDNINRQLIIKELQESRVYFSSSKETLGLAVLEGIASGCIPVVVNNSANVETVPFPELRFKEGDLYKARDIISDALAGNLDYLVPKLQEHVKRFKRDNYEQLLEDVILNAKN